MYEKHYTQTTANAGSGSVRANRDNGSHHIPRMPVASYLPTQTNHPHSFTTVSSGHGTIDLAGYQQNLVNTTDILRNSSVSDSQCNQQEVYLLKFFEKFLILLLSDKDNIVIKAGLY